MSIRRFSTIVLILPCIVMASRGTSGNDKTSAAFAISIEDFQQTNSNDQNDLIVEAVEYRLQHGKNLFYEARRTMRIHDYVDATKTLQDSYQDSGQIGNLRFQGATWINRHWRLGDSYRMDTDSYGRKNSPSPLQFLVTGFDAEAGVARSTDHTVGNQRLYGRIDVHHNPMPAHNRYAYWLDGEHTPHGEHIFRYLLDHRNEMTIEAPVEDNLVQVEAPWQPHFMDVPIGVRRFFLDPEKGFFPVRGYGKWERTRANGQLSWRREEFFVEKSQLVGDVWMPTKLKEVLGASTGQENSVTVYETEILRIEHGTVKPEDLIVPFKEGMQVVDAIEGIAYVVDTDGSPKPGSIENLVGADAITAIASPNAADGTDQPQPPSSRMWLILVNVGLFLIIAALILLRRSRSRKTG